MTRVEEGRGLSPPDGVARVGEGLVPSRLSWTNEQFERKLWPKRLPVMSNLPSRKCIRIPGYDYSQPGFYFISVCTHGRAEIFGTIDTTFCFRPMPLGTAIEAELRGVVERFCSVRLDCYAIMPDHLHAILELTGNGHTLFDVVGAFKSLAARNAASTFQIHKLWQRAFYDHVIRTEASLMQIRQYVADNPAQLRVDDLNRAGYYEWLRHGRGQAPPLRTR